MEYADVLCDGCAESESDLLEHVRGWGMNLHVRPRVSAVYIKFLEECEGNISKTYYDDLYSLVRFLIISNNNNV